MELMCIVVTIGTVVQTASVNIGMFLAGRALAGFAVGQVNPGSFGWIPGMLSVVITLTNALVASWERSPYTLARSHHRRNAA